MLFDNCGPRLYGSFLYSCAGLMSESEGLVQIASQKFLEDLQSLFKNPQLDPFVRDKILQLLGQWTETLKNQPGFQEIEALHKSLSSQAQSLSLSSFSFNCGRYCLVLSGKSTNSYYHCSYYYSYPSYYSYPRPCCICPHSFGP